MNVLMILSWLLAVLGALVAISLLVFAVAGHWSEELPPFNGDRFRRIAVLIPAYREDAVILTSVLAVLEQDYPRNSFEVFVIADSLRAKSLRSLADLPVTVIPVAFAESTKAKALNAALAQIPADQFDSVVVLDADNVMASDFLRRANGGLQAGHRVIQGRRLPKVTDSPLARLDALTEAINTHIFRKGRQALGLPAALTGSGMVFEIELFKSLMLECEAVGGFDKELEFELARRGIAVAYDELAVVLDEKISTASMLTAQRSRWMGAQWHYARRYALDALLTFPRTRNWAYLDKALQMIAPPRLLFLSGLSIAAVLGAGLGQPALAWVFAASAWGTLVAMRVSIPRDHLWMLFRDVGHWPIAFTACVGSLLRSFRANRSFIHTSHSEGAGRQH